MVPAGSASAGKILFVRFLNFLFLCRLKTKRKRRMMRKNRRLMRKPSESGLRVCKKETSALLLVVMKKDCTVFFSYFLSAMSVGSAEKKTCARIIPFFSFFLLSRVFEIFGFFFFNLLRHFFRSRVSPPSFFNKLFSFVFPHIC